MARRDEEREKRLAEALRENLRRRKAQARGEECNPSSRRKPGSMNTDGGERARRCSWIPGQARDDD